MAVPLLYQLMVVFALSVVVLFVFLNLRLPAAVGFLLTGVIAGPHGFRLIEAVHEVELLAEIGVVLLLFTIGIEFSLKNFLRVKRAVLLGGTLQVALTVAAVTGLVAVFSDMEIPRAVFVGMLLALSSTAIALKVLQEKAQIDAPHGRLALSILILQDVAVVPMMLLTPYLAGTSAEGRDPLWILAFKALGILVFVAVGARWLAPAALYQVARTRSRELFLLAVLIICFGVAWLTSILGLSLALGAFLAGLIISESEYSHQTLGNVLPFRDVFTGLFFVSIGMLLDVKFVLANPATVAGIVLTVIVLKGMMVHLAAFFLGAPFRVGLMAGLSLCQIGEFSFVLALTGISAGLLDSETYQLFLAVAVLTMGLTPFLIALAPLAGAASLKLPLPRIVEEGIYATGEPDRLETKALTDHLIVVGYWVNGRNVVQAARAAGIPHVVIEMNPETVRKEKENGVPIFYGDATSEAVLEHARILEARVLALAIPDPAATRGVVALARRLNPSLYIIARTRFVTETAPLYDLGADVVIPEEFETSVEIFTRVLAKYLVPQKQIDKFTSEIRSGGYRMFRSATQPGALLTGLDLRRSGMEITTVIAPANTPLAGRSLGEIDLRNRFGVTLLGLEREGAAYANLDAEATIQAGDRLFLIGEPDRLAEFAAVLDPEAD